ncbi:MAG TPA: tyrosine-type recombinase/integrase [Casimicrobiaceae bacterium]|nr:tyrosine-type recombinase/integrase [Casimicrobiaceae bacterium]
MGRPRKTRTDLPDGLHFRANRGTYYYRATRGEERSYVEFGRVTREQAIREWIKITAKPENPAEDGTVGEIIDRYVAEEVPRRLRLGKIAKITADEYRRQAPALRTEFGARKFARTPAESDRRDLLRTADVDAYLRRLEGTKGASMANHLVATLSAAFSFARRAGICTYNPCVGAERNVEQPRKVIITDDVRDKLLKAAPPALRLIASLSDVTTLRKTDIRLLMLTQIGDEWIRVTPSKTRRRTGKTIEFAITPAVRAILSEAAALPGRKISMYVFPTRKGTPYSESALQTAWARAKLKAGFESVDLTFRDFRTTELNAIHREGGDATKTAGHASASTTQRHYITEPTRIKPRR